MKKHVAMFVMFVMFAGLSGGISGQAQQIDFLEISEPLSSTRLGTISPAFQPEQVETNRFSEQEPSGLPNATPHLSDGQQMHTEVDALLPKSWVPDVSNAAVLAATLADVPQVAPMDQARMEVDEVIKRWVKAWSDKDVDTYLSQYSSEFHPPDFDSVQAWKKQRRWRLTRPKFIVVTAQDIQFVAIDSVSMRVSFTQAYQSDVYADSVAKQLEFRKTGRGWKIQKEVVAN